MVQNEGLRLQLELDGVRVQLLVELHVDAHKLLIIEEGILGDRPNDLRVKVDFRGSRELGIGLSCLVPT